MYICAPPSPFFGFFAVFLAISYFIFQRRFLASRFATRGLRPCFARVGLFATSPSRIHFIHAFRWFRCYPSRLRTFAALAWRFEAEFIELAKSTRTAQPPLCCKFCKFYKFCFIYERTAAPKTRPALLLTTYFLLLKPAQFYYLLLTTNICKN
jgi:hypothetical protein